MRAAKSLKYHAISNSLGRGSFVSWSYIAHCRRRCEEERRAASQELNADRRAGHSKLADQYERLANTYEKLEGMQLTPPVEGHRRAN